MKKESSFQMELVKELESKFPGCDIQGIPDLIVLYKNKWAMLECKRSKKERHRPNQDYYIEKMGKMSYASFIYPENKEEVLNELQRAFGIRRKTRVSKR